MIELEISGKKAREVQIRNFVVETIREMDVPITEFDSGLWCGLVDYVTVYGRDSIKVKFKDGTEIYATEQNRRRAQKTQRYF